MTIDIDAPNKTLSIVFTDDEWGILAKANTKQPGELRNLISNWLKGKEASFIQADIEAIIGKVKTLTPAQLANIKQALGL